MPIKYKLFLYYAAVFLVLFSLSFTFHYFRVRSGIMDRIRQELTTSNQIITGMVDSAADLSIKNHLRGIAENNLEIIESLYREYRDNRISESEARERAVRILLSQHIGDTGYIYCVSSDGVALVHPREGVAGKKFLDHPFVRAQIQNKTGYLEYDWKNPEESEARPKALYMTYFEPWDWIISVTSYKSEFSKLVEIEDIRENISKLTFGKTGYSFIFDTTGKIIIHPELSDKAFGDLGIDGQQILQDMVARKKGYLTYSWKNPSEKEEREKIVAFDSIPSFNWIIASSFYTREVFSPLRDMQKDFLIILVLTLTATGLVTLAISNSMTRPLTDLIHRFEKGSKGDLFFRVDNDRGDEIGQLSDSFNLFMTKLETYRNEILSENRVRREAEQELQKVQQYLSNIIDSMPSVLIGVDETLGVTLWNRKAEEMTGLSGVDARAKPLSDALPGIHVDMEKIRECLKKNETRTWAKLPYAAPGRETRYQDITVYPLQTGRMKGAVIRMDDVTEKIRLEEVLVQNEKILSVGGLAAGMAHEINNPLAGVIQNAAVLSNRLMDARIPANITAAEKAGTTMKSISEFMLSRNIPSMIRAITESASRMAAIVENMLSFARKSDSSFSTQDPVTLLEKTLALASTDYNLKKQYDFKSITINKEYEANLPLVSCESSKIQQVLLNILANGAHALLENKTGAKPVFTLRLKAETSPPMLRIEIEDNGPGMTEEIRKRVFEPFFTTKPVGTGTGLGLSVSYFIITENHGGTMDVVSEPGKGTTFIIRLPLERKKIKE
ncbi:MAG: cache domain-containing protein [Desulfobacteraceae bacterium]|nr:cache domain-containing protein [Desulfobacteraceae bacterium]